MHIIGNKIDYNEQVKSFVIILTGIITLFGIIYSFSFLKENTLISFKNLVAISFFLSSITLSLFFRNHLAFLKKLWFVALAFIGLLTLFYSYLFLGVNFVKLSDNEQNIKCPIIGFSEKTRRFNRKSSHAKVVYEDRIVKVKIPYNPFYNKNQYPFMVLTTRAGLLGVEVLVDKELLQGYPPPMQIK